MKTPQVLSSFARVAICSLSIAATPLLASDDNDWWSMGPVGGSFQVQSGKTYIAVRAVEAGSPAELAGLQVGDYIMGAYGKNFLYTGGSTSGYKGAPQGFAEAIERAESSDGLMPLTLLRPGVGAVDVTVTLPVVGAFGPAYPLGSTKFDGIYQRAASKIHQNIEGTSNGDVGYMSGFYGIVLLADPNWNDTTGAKPYRLSIDKMRDRAVAVLDGAIVNPVEATNLDGTPNDGSVNDSDPNDQSYVSVGLENWGLSTWAMFLAEYRAKTGDTSVDATVQRAADLFAGRIQTWQQPPYGGSNGPTKVGLMGHGGVGGDYPHVGYSGMNIINAHAMTAMAMLQQAGATIDDTKMQATWNWVKGTTNADGNIGYAWKQGGYDSGGRTAGVAYAMSVYGGLNTADQAVLTTMKDYVSREWQRMQHTHAYTAGGTQFYQFVLPYLPDRDQRFIMENQKMFYHFHRTTTEALKYFGGRENNGGDGYVNTGRVAYAGVAMAQAVASGNLTTVASIDSTRIHADFQSPFLTWPTLDARYVEIDAQSQAFTVDVTDYQGASILPVNYTAIWTHVSGPGTATFTSPNTASTTVNFPQDGTYRIQLEVVSSGYTLTEPIDVVVGSVTAPVGYRFGANQRMFTNLSGGNVSDLTGYANYPDSPDSMSNLTALDTSGGSDYGQRVSGYIVAPSTGSYTFYVAADDAAEFHFNSAGTDPAGASMICSTTTWTDQYEWTQDASQTSTAVTLTAGQLYYYELLHKQGGGGVHATVAWSGPGIATPTVISGNDLVVSDATTMVTQPQSQTTTLGGSATMSVSTEGEGPFVYEWFLDGSSLGLTTSSTFTVSDVSGGQAGGYHCVVTYPGGTLTSATAILTVSDAGVLVQGGLWRDQFDGLGGNAIADMTASVNYPRFPSLGGVVTVAGTSDSGEGSFGARYSGWITPDVSGDHVFYLTSDDASEVWLSTDDQPMNKVLITQISGATSERAWESVVPTSPISLVAGQRYYIEILHKEGGGADHCGVAWQRPGDAAPMNGSSPIVGQYLSYFTGGVHGTSVVMPPAFDSSTYNWTLAETSTVGASLGGVSATSTNTPITYAISTGNEGGKFAINSSTGEITLAGALDFETVPSYALTVQATDSTGLIGQVQVGVAVGDIYDAQFVVNTNFEASDNFTGYSGHAALAATTDLLGNQWSTPNNGRIWNMGGLAPSGDQCLVLGVAGNPATAEVVIPGTDHGVSSVTFDYASFSSSTNVTFALSYRVGGGAWVQAWSDTVVGMTLDWQVKPWTSVTVDINQSGDVDLKLETTGTNGVLVDTFQVKDNRPNVAPVVTNSVASVAEGQAGLVVGTVNATDANSGDPLTYSIIAGNSGEFAIDAVTGEITTALALDYQVQAQHVLTVQATDSLGLSDTGTVTVDVTEFISNLDAIADAVSVPSGSASTPYAVMANDRIPTGATGSVLGFYNSVAHYDAGSAGAPADPLVSAGGSWTGSEGEDGNYATGNVTGLPSINDNGSGLDAWVVTDNTTAGAQWITYTKTPDAAAITAANTNGWIFETNMRFVDDFGAGVSTVLIYGNGITRFLVFFELNGSGDLVAQTFGTGGATYTLTSGGTGTQDFHHIQMVYDPATAKAAFLVDGVRYDSGAWAGQGNGFTGVQWGNGSSGGKGSAAFNQVKWGYIDTGASLASGATASYTNDELVFDPNGGYLTLGAGESTDENLTYVVKASDGQTQVGNIVVTVNGENDAPMVDDNTGSLAENASVGSAVATVNSTDPDATDVVTYAITAGNTGGAFAIDTNSGAITTATSLNFETAANYSLTVTGTDGSAASDTATVTVTVTDVNEAPVASDAAGNVAENTAAGAAVATVSAVDPDAGDSVTYAITSGNTGNVFAIDSVSGAITTTAALDYETTSQYVLTVTATDTGALSDTATVTVGVTNVNEAPVAIGGSGSVAENTAAGAAVATVGVNDVDAGDSANFAITAGNTGNAFAIDASGNITTATTLDFEATPSYALTVTVTDGGGLSDTAAVSVSVTNVNEAPVATGGSGNIAENSVVGTPVATVGVSDPDAGDSANFAIVSGNTGNAFAIDAAGNITTAAALDFETTPSYTLTVSVTDGGGLSDSAAVNVTVTNSNESPVFASDPIVAAAGATLAAYSDTLAATASDSDAGDTLSFSKISGPAWLAVASDGALSGTPGASDAGLNSFTVEVSDGNGGAAQATLEITITASSVILSEDFESYDVENPSDFSVGGTPTGNWTASNTAANATRTFNTSNYGGTRLWISNVDGSSITSAGATVADNTHYSLSAVLLVETSVGSSTLNATYDVLVGQDAATATSIIGGPQAVVTNGDDWQTPDSKTDHVFTQGFQTGTLAPGDQLFVRFTRVSTLSTGGWFGVDDVLVDTVGANSAPVADDAVFAIAENGSAAEAVGTVVATDADAGDVLSYAITAGNGGGEFAIDSATGAITTTTGFDYESAASYALTVTVSDGSAQSDTAAITVDVTNVNEAPVAVDNSGSVAEDASIGAAVTTVAASDVDAGTTLSYAITAGNGGGEFAIDAAGNITTAAALDFETTPSYALTVTVTDDGAPALSDTAAVTVNVTNINEAPVANNGSGSVDENVSAGTAVATATATDVDAGDTLSYAITAGNTGGAFAIDSNSGAITTAGAIDYETLSSYTLTITVTDAGSLTDTATINVTVNDINEVTAPVVATGAASAIIQTTADVAYTVTDDGGDAPAVTVYYGETDGGQVAGNWTNSAAQGNQATGGYSASLSGLTEGTTYYFTVQASNSAGTVWGSSGSFTTEADASAKLVRTTVSAVSSTSWTNVDLGQNYTSAVIVATPIYPNTSIVPVVTRIQNVSGSTFDLKIDRADGLTGEVTIDVSVIAIEEGVYTQATDGVTMEAVKYTSTVTADNGSWVAEARTLQNTYTSPVVVGQVMSANDANWSTFWSMGNSRTAPASVSNFNVGKHVGEDPNTTRANETIGYIVIESGNGTINGVAYEAALGADSVRGFGNSSNAYTYTLSGTLSTASAAAASVSGMDGNNGAWAVLSGATPITPTSLGLHALEDQMNDAEQSHTTTQVGYLVFE